MCSVSISSIDYIFPSAVVTLLTTPDIYVFYKTYSISILFTLFFRPDISDSFAIILTTALFTTVYLVYISFFKSKSNWLTFPSSALVLFFILETSVFMLVTSVVNVYIFVLITSVS